MSVSDDFLRAGFLGDLTALRSLQFRCKFTSEQAARACLVSPETYRRWRTDRRPNPTAVRLLAIFAGYVPWIDWQGWEVHAGLLFPPGFTRHGIGPGDIQAITFREQLVSEYRRRVLELEVSLARERAVSARSL